MASVTYVGYVVPTSEANMSDIITEWERELKGARGRILDHLLSKIADENDFKTKLVAPAVAGYTNYINPVYPKATSALLKYRAKLGKAYMAWDSAVNNAFAENGIFETNVSAKKDKMANAKYTVGAVGQKAVLGYNAITKGIMAITGDSRLPIYIESEKGDSLTGTPINVFDPAVTNYVKPLFIAPAVRACVFIYYATEANDASLRTSIINDFNTFTSNVINAFKISGATASFELAWDTVRDPNGSIKVTVSGEIP